VPLFVGWNLIKAATITTGEAIDDQIQVRRHVKNRFADLTIELTWSGQQGDMDLHLIRVSNEWPSFFDFSEDCHFRNCLSDGNSILDWGESDEIKDNPYLAQDALFTPGMEIIYLNSPENVIYFVYVDAFSGKAGCEVAISINGRTYRFGPMEIDRDNPFRQIWRVAVVDWQEQAVVLDNSLFSRESLGYDEAVSK